MTDDILIDRIRAHRSAPDVYDPPTFEDMADRIMKLEKAYDAWASVVEKYKDRCTQAEEAREMWAQVSISWAERAERAEANLNIAMISLRAIADMNESNVTAYIQKVDAIALDALDQIALKP